MKVQVKDEQLEHMTFLVDEKDLEIEEVKTTLTMYNNSGDDLKQSNDKLSQLEKELEVVTDELEKTLKEGREKDVILKEYLKSVKQQQEEISRYAFILKSKFLIETKFIRTIIREWVFSPTT